MSSSIELVIIGTIQDGGLPQLGCICPNCSNAQNFPKRFRSSLAVKLEESFFLIDATPDIAEQCRYIRKIWPTVSLSGIFLTHLHIGHYMGLIYLGRESGSQDLLPVYCTPSVSRFLKKNKPFSYLIERNEIKIEELSDQPWIFNNLEVTKINVPHRNEDGDTNGYSVRNKERDFSLLYIPDIDYLPLEIMNKFKDFQHVIFDGTFFSKNEIKRQENVPHPPIKETLSLLELNFHKSFFFTHFNHTNPVLNPKSEAYKICILNGFKIALEGTKIIL